MEYKATVNDEYISHYGTKGMKWGRRKARYTSGRKKLPNVQGTGGLNAREGAKLTNVEDIPKYITYGAWQATKQAEKVKEDPVSYIKDTEKKIRRTDIPDTIKSVGENLLRGTLGDQTYNRITNIINIVQKAEKHRASKG